MGYSPDYHLVRSDDIIFRPDNVNCCILGKMAQDLSFGTLPIPDGGYVCGEILF